MDDDSLWVKQVLAGETEFFRDLVGRYKDAVFAVALSKVRNFADAEDIAQDVFVSAYQSLGTLRDSSRFAPWLYAIAHNKIRSHLRVQKARRRHQEQLRDALGPARSKEASHQEQQTQATVLEALERLAEPNRETAALFYINGYSQEDISRFTNRPVGTVKRRLHQARRQLRKELMDMVTDRLKKHRPDEGFTQSVYRRVAEVRVQVKGGAGNGVLVRDSEDRSFEFFIGTTEAKCLEPWLRGKAPRKTRDIYLTLVDLLKTFGCAIERVAIEKLETSTFYASLVLKSDHGEGSVDCRPSDALNLAVRAKAPVFVNKAVADACMLRDGKGKPLSPAAASRVIQRMRGGTDFKDIPQVLELLQSHPDNRTARLALKEATPELIVTPSRVRNLEGAWDATHSWVKRSTGTRFEGLANGLLGALYLYSPRRQAQEAARYLERAHRLCPGDEDVAFDLATAYAWAHQRDEALSLVEKYRFAKAREYGNLRDLWKDPRFIAAIGQP